jgi:arsenate reductase
MILYFNPECSKCNEALDLLHANNCEVQIRNYLTDPPTVSELKELVLMLGCRITDIIRTKEPVYGEQFEGKSLPEESWFRILSENPVLIERPILISGGKAIIGRPPLLVLKLAEGDAKQAPAD